MLEGENLALAVVYTRGVELPDISLCRSDCVINVVSGRLGCCPTGQTCVGELPQSSSAPVVATTTAATTAAATVATTATAAAGAPPS